VVRARFHHPDNVQPCWASSHASALALLRFADLRVVENGEQCSGVVHEVFDESPVGIVGMALLCDQLDALGEA